MTEAWQEYDGRVNGGSVVFAAKCGVKYVHDNSALIGPSRAENHMTRCAISAVFDNHVDSQLPARLCQPYSQVPLSVRLTGTTVSQTHRYHCQPYSQVPLPIRLTGTIASQTHRYHCQPYSDRLTGTTVSRTIVTGTIVH